jgi:putative ABC transport system permease protein
MGHLLMRVVGSTMPDYQAFTGTIFLLEEIYPFLLAIAIGILAGIIPAILAYRSNLSRILRAY